MVTLGLLQYLAPILQFALGVLYFHEDMPAGRWVGFVLVWVALVIFTDEAITHHRRQLQLEALGRPSDGASTASAWRSTRLTGPQPSDGSATELAGQRLRRSGWRPCRRRPRGRRGPGRRGGREERLGLGGAVDDVGAGLRPWPGGARSRSSASACSASSVRSPASSSSRRASAGSVEAWAISTGSVGTPSRRSVPGVLPDSVESEATSMMSSESWKAEPTISPYAASASSTSGRGAAEAGAVAGRGGDQGAGLAGDDLEVVRERVLVGAGLDGLEDLALDQPGERLGLDADGVRAQQGGELGGLREQEVAGQDRDQVVPAGVGRLRAAAQRRPRP